MADLLTKTTVSALLEAAGSRPKRSLGQNFVIDPNTVRKIARLAGVGPGQHVIEIGAGLGSLTLALAETGATVVAVEIDQQILPQLKAMVEPHGVRVVQADAMKIDWQEFVYGIAADGIATGWKLVANLPYNIATPLVIDLLESASWVSEMLIMVQLEVAERLAALPRTKAYGAVSLKVSYWAETKIVGRVSSEVFVPKPNVTSGLVSIKRRATLPASPASYEELFGLVKAGFANRRKMLKGLIGNRLAPEAFAMAEIPERARAEELSLDDWIRLASHLRRQ